MMDAVLLLSFTALSVVARPHPQPQPQATDPLPTATLVDLAKSAKGTSGQKTRVASNAGGTVTRIINNTVTTGKWRSSSSKSPSALKGKIAGIVLGVIFGLIILSALAIFIHKWRKRGTGHVCGEDQVEEGMEKKVDPDQDNVEVEPASSPTRPTGAVPGEMAYASEPANKPEVQSTPPESTAVKADK